VEELVFLLSVFFDDELELDEELELSDFAADWYEELR